MKKRKVISHKNLPARMPLSGTLVCFLALDRIGAPGWVWGIVGTLLVVVWWVYVMDVKDQVDVEILDER